MKEKKKGKAKHATPADLRRRERQALDLENRVKKRLKQLRRWARKRSLEAYRVYHRDIPEIPLVVDVYGPYLHLSLFSGRGGHGKDPQPDRWMDEMVAACERATGVSREKIFVKRRRHQTRQDQYRKHDAPSLRAVVKEGEAQFDVELRSYLDTGLFLDHRDTRFLVGSVAQGKRILNLFSYTGAFSVHAALGGAEATLSVDLSKRYCKWAASNFELNGLNAKLLEEGDEQRAKHRILRADVLKWIKHPTEPFDLIIVDPPTFSNSKKMSGSFDVQRDHPALLEQLSWWLSEDGEMIFSTNRQDFALSKGLEKEFQVAEITEAMTPFDFKGKPQHRGWILRNLP